MLAEQLILICDPLFHVQDDPETALDLSLLTGVIAVDEAADRNYYRIVPEYKDRPDCTGEDLADREVVYLTGKMTVRGRARLEIVYGLKALARGTSAAPVAQGDGSYIHTSGRLPAYDFDLPYTTMALADAAPGGTLKKLLRRVVVSRIDIIGGNGEDFMFEMELDFHPDVTDAPLLVVPACSDALTLLAVKDAALTVGGVDRSDLLFDARSNYNNKLREGKVRRTNNSIYPTRTLRDARREESIDVTLSTEMDHALAVAADTKAQTDYPTVLRMGTATRYLQDSYPHARLEGDIDKAEQALVTKAKFVPIKSGGVTSITTCRSTVSQQYLQAAP